MALSQPKTAQSPLPTPLSPIPNVRLFNFKRNGGEGEEEASIGRGEAKDFSRIGFTFMSCHDPWVCRGSLLPIMLMLLGLYKRGAPPAFPRYPIFLPIYLFSPSYLIISTVTY
jgi:hypothetical protein